MEQKVDVDKESIEETRQKVREVLKDPENLKCTCPEISCEWYNKCKQCVAIHRYYCDHLPVCLQPIIKEKIKALAGTAELNISER